MMPSSGWYNIARAKQCNRKIPAVHSKQCGLFRQYGLGIRTFALRDGLNSLLEATFLIVMAQSHQRKA